MVVRAPSLEAGLTAARDLAAETAAQAGLATPPDCAGGCMAHRIIGSLERGEEVRAEVTVDLPGVVVPFVGVVGGGSWTAVHVERVDDFRSLP